jgi:hypothetical protein
MSNRRAEQAGNNVARLERSSSAADFNIVPWCQLISNAAPKIAHQ